MRAASLRFRGETMDVRTSLVALGAVLALAACEGSGAGADGGDGGGDGGAGAGGAGGGGPCVPADEASRDACHNGVDDDCDGFVDCGDFSCSRGPAGNLCCEGDGQPEADDERCGNGIDDDCDGYVDCQDFSCSARSGVTVCCGDDGQSVPESSDALCANGWDDDCNGFTDCHDFGCGAGNGVTACCGDGAAEDTPERCANGVDDDCNGYVDCRDFSCSRNAAVPLCCTPEPEDAAAACGNGRDDDCDGLADCEDESCTADPGRSHCRPPCTPSGLEEGDAACANGDDEDCDGYVDCQDFDCSRDPNVTVCGTGAAANCEPCDQPNDCRGGACRHYLGIPDAPSFCSSACESDADCAPGLSRCSETGFCIHADAELTATCSLRSNGRVWTDGCGIEHGLEPCPEGTVCTSATEGEDDARCAPPCRELGAIVETSDGEVCCPGLTPTYDPAPPVYTERCLVAEGEPCAADHECASGRACLQGRCADCFDVRACTTDADCCDGYGCNGGTCAQLCGAECRGSSYVAGIFCYSSCATRFRCTYECSDP